MADNQSSAPEQPPAPSNSPETSAAPPVVVKKYANRRLYNTETSSYITLDNLAEMIRAGRDFVVYDAKSGDDITRGVLTQIIVEEESKGSAMLPVAFLRQLIGFYGGSLQGVVPRYLEFTLSSFARQQQQARQVMERTLGPFLPSGVEEMSRQNMALFERAVSMWNPFHRANEPEPHAPALEQSPHQSSDPREEIARLRDEVDNLRRQLVAAHAASVAPTLESIAPAAAPANVLRDPQAREMPSSRRRTAPDPSPHASVPEERRDAKQRDPGNRKNSVR